MTTKTTTTKNETPTKPAGGDDKPAVKTERREVPPGHDPAPFGAGANVKG